MPSTKTDANANVRYRINFAKTLSFSYRSKELLELDQLDLDTLKLNFRHKFNILKDEKLIEIDFGTKFHHGEVKHELVEYSLRMSYRIINFDKVVTPGNNPKIYDIEDRLMFHLMGLTISTARGILISHLMNTDYKNIYIPVFTEQEIESFFFSNNTSKKKSSNK
jgi:hypothetical protein